MIDVIGRESSPETNWNPVREETRWIGKPWRRVELLTQRYLYEGEQDDVWRTLTLHFGFRRLGLGFTLEMSKRSYLDYSEEAQ